MWQERRRGEEGGHGAHWSLGIGPEYLSPKMEDGMHVMTVNSHLPCSNPCLGHGLPPHSDDSCFTVVLKSCPGLQILDDPEDGAWKLVPTINGALQVHAGDHLEVLCSLE